jgi:amino acid transporter
VVAIAFVTALAIVLAATGDLATLADTTVLLLLGVFIVVNMSVLVLRRDEVEHDHFRTPLVFPVLGALACAIVMTQPSPEIYARAGLLLGLGLLLWLANRLLGERGRRAGKLKEPA